MFELEAGSISVADHRPAGTKRLDSFVDSAFAFAATILVVGKSTSMRGYDEMMVELSRVPAFGISLCIILSFWWAHRSFSLFSFKEDAVCEAVSIAIMIVVLIFVFPLRFMVEAAVHWLSDGQLPGPGLTADQIRPAYVIFGAGFSLLSGLYAGLYARLLRARAQLGLRRSQWLIVARRLIDWLIGMAAGFSSILLEKLNSLDTVVWLPSFPYLGFAMFVMVRKAIDFNRPTIRP